MLMIQLYYTKCCSNFGLLPFLMPNHFPKQIISSVLSLEPFKSTTMLPWATSSLVL